MLSSAVLIACVAGPAAAPEAAPPTWHLEHELSAGFGGLLNELSQGASVTGAYDLFFNEFLGVRVLGVTALVARDDSRMGKELTRLDPLQGSYTLPPAPTLVASTQAVLALRHDEEVLFGGGWSVRAAARVGPAWAMLQHINSQRLPIGAAAMDTSFALQALLGRMIVGVDFGHLWIPDHVYAEHGLYARASVGGRL